jgi:prepilin-type N-terminal cleavage/methylation domain-containing protein
VGGSTRKEQHMPAKTTGKHRAFTLVELLVVIAIICLLLVILMPSFSRAKQSARRMICVSHLSAIGSGVSGYVGDNNGALMPSGGGWTEVQPVRQLNQPGPTVVVHSWSTCTWNPACNQCWFWADFIVGYFDGDARPTHLVNGNSQDAQCGYASVMAQPKSGNYYEFMGDGGGLVLSKRLNCPDQACTVELQTPTDSHWPAGRRGHYTLIAGASELYGFGYDTWTIPNDGQVHTSPATQAEPQPTPPPYLRAANYPMDRLVYIGEPVFNYEDLAYYSFAQNLYNNLPHQMNGDEAGNFMFMDGHIETFTRTYIKNWSDKRFPGNPGNGTQYSWGPGYPFAE